MDSDTTRSARRFRSRDWFDDPERIDQTAIYLACVLTMRGFAIDTKPIAKPLVFVLFAGSVRRPS